MINDIRKIKKGDFKFHDEYWRHVSADAKVRIILKIQNFVTFYF